MKINDKSGQVQVRYSFGNRYHYYWVHGDDKDEIEFAEQIVRNKENIEDVNEFIKQFCEDEDAKIELPFIPKLMQRISGSLLGRSRASSISSGTSEGKVSRRHRSITVEDTPSCWGLFGWMKWFTRS